MHAKAKKQVSLAVGATVAFAAFAASWAALGLVGTIIAWSWFIIAAMLVLWLLERRKSKLAKVAAVMLASNTIFLFFMPKHIRAGLQKLVEREKRAT